MSSHSRSILLTGGAGFIGSHLAESLLRLGVRLTIVDNLDGFYSPARKKDNLEEVRRINRYDFAAVNICDLNALRTIVRAAEPEAIIHLAARAGVRQTAS